MARIVETRGWEGRGRTGGVGTVGGSWGQSAPIGWGLGLLGEKLGNLRRPLSRDVRLPRAYLGYVGLSALDVLGTALILALGGIEVNPVADAVLVRFGMPGMTAFKFLIVALVIALCERIVREKPRAARGVMTLAIGATCLPVAVVLTECACYLWLLQV